MLTPREITLLIKYLNAPCSTKYFGEVLKNNWQLLIFAWNNQNEDYNPNTIYPKKEKLEDDFKIPDYKKLNINWIEKASMISKKA
jgi:hypothetical protein